MVRTLTLGGAAWRCAILVSCLLVTGPPPASAQMSPVAQSVPGLDGIANASIRQITRDGTRIVVHMTPVGDGHTLVLDLRTGATVFDSRRFLETTRLRDVDLPVLSPDGLFFAASTYNGLHGTQYVGVWKLTTGERVWTLDDLFGDTSMQAVADGATSIVGLRGIGSPAGPVVVVGRPVQPPQDFDTSCRREAFPKCPQAPVTMSADGAYLAYRYTESWPDVATQHHELRLADVAARAARLLPIVHPELGPGLWPSEPWAVKISGDGNWVGFTGQAANSGAPRAALIHRATGVAVIVAAALGPTYFHDVSDDARFVLLAGEHSKVSGQQLRVVDRLTGLVSHVLDPLDTPLGRYRVLSARLSGDGRTIVATLGDGATSDPTPRRTFIARLDSDDDGMSDSWEVTFGLDPASPADASEDPDGDGVSSAREYAAGTHPKGGPVRHFAEGADGAFFATSVALYNPSTTTVTANLRFLGPDGAVASTPVMVPAAGPAFVEVSRLGLPFGEFAMVVESPVLLAAERRMTWDRTGQYGSHADTGVEAPSTTWHFAEGATIAGIQTFFLLQNPGDTPAHVTMRYLRAAGTPEERRHVVPARSRLTVWANQEGAPMDASEFSTIIASDQPVVAERAMYRDAPGERFAAGSVASGIASPASSWFFAEGATGPFFDTYLLLSNPGDIAATVTAQYVRAFDPADTTTATPIDRSYVVEPHSRLTVWVARESPRLRDTQLSTRITSTQPIVAERTQWWPGPTAATWRENHAEVGARAGGFRWAVADLQADPQADGWDTFLLVATTEPYLANILVTVSCDDGTRASRAIHLSANRTTLWMRYEFPETVGRRCAATVESLPARVTSSPSVPLIRTPIVVEAAMYRGTDFRAGGGALATRLPDPP